MKNFRDLVEEVIPHNIDMDNEEWSRTDLKDLIDELDEDDIAYITDIVMDLLSYEDDYDWEDMEDTVWADYEDLDDEETGVTEKMSAEAKRAAKKKRRKPAFKKAMRLKKKCMKKHAKKIKQSKNAGVPYVCGTDGKIHKGMKKADRRKLAKTRKRHKGRIIK